MPLVPRKQIRLPPEEYLGLGTYFVTICSEERLPIFQNAKRALAAIEALRRVSDSTQFLIHAFCLMPDHAHFLVEGKRPGSDLVKFVARWKQMTGYLFRHELPPRFWQRRFYDHVLRSVDDSDPIAWYIWLNPVRKGIVAEAHEYPFSGSFTTGWPKTSVPAKPWFPPWKAKL
jgi:putative transposase